MARDLFGNLHNDVVPSLVPLTKSSPNKAIVTPALFIVISTIVHFVFHNVERAHVYCTDGNCQHRSGSISLLVLPHYRVHDWWCAWCIGVRLSDALARFRPFVLANADTWNAEVARRDSGWHMRSVRDDLPRWCVTIVAHKLITIAAFYAKTTSHRSGNYGVFRLNECVNTLITYSTSYLHCS